MESELIIGNEIECYCPCCKTDRFGTVLGINSDIEYEIECLTCHASFCISETDEILS